MHNAAMAQLGLDFVYVACRVAPEALPAAMQAMRALNLCGLNVTVPHKQAVMALLDEVAPEARAIGAVNTVVNRGGRLVGYNTDAFGVIESLRRDGGMVELPPRVALMGAGGAARAILYALLARAEVEQILLLNRSLPRAQALAAAMGGGARVQVTGLDGADALDLTDIGLLINATSVGMHPAQNASPLPDGSCLEPPTLVLDIVYNPLRTRLMQQAEAAGARALNGLGMLVCQGARAFEIWTGQWPPVETMLAAALESFALAARPTT
jgi:shikimate dehydrogenase